MLVWEMVAWADSQVIFLLDVDAFTRGATLLSSLPENPSCRLYSVTLAKMLDFKIRHSEHNLKK